MPIYYQRACGLLLFAICLTTSVAAQYATTINQGGEVLTKIEVDQNGTSVVSEITITEIEVIDGLFYRRALARIGSTSDMLVGYVREDTESARVFFRPLNSATDILVYDISLSVGDTLSLDLPYCDGFPTDLATVTAVNTVDGRRVLTFDRQFGADLFCETLEFVEGVGPTANLLFPLFNGEAGALGDAVRLCRIRIDGDLYYPNTTSTDLCGLQVSSTYSAEAARIEVWPNPAHDVLNVSGLPNGAAIHLYNTLGEGLGRYQPNAPIDISHLRPGLYQWVCPTANGERASGKIVVY